MIDEAADPKTTKGRRERREAQNAFASGDAHGGKADGHVAPAVAATLRVKHVESALKEISMSRTELKDKIDNMTLLLNDFRTRPTLNKILPTTWFCRNMMSSC